MILIIYLFAEIILKFRKYINIIDYFYMICYHAFEVER